MMLRDAFDNSARCGFFDEIIRESSHQNGDCGASCEDQSRIIHVTVVYSRESCECGWDSACYLGLQSMHMQFGSVRNVNAFGSIGRGLRIQ